MLRVAGEQKKLFAFNQKEPSLKRLIVPLQRLKKQALSSHHSPEKGIARGFTMKEAAQVLEEVAKNEITFQKSELRRNLTYLSNRLLLEINRSEKEGALNIPKLQSILKNELSYLSTLSEMLDLGPKIDGVGPHMLSPTMTEKRIPNKDRRHRLQLPNPDNEHGFHVKEALERVGLFKVSSKLSLNYLGRSYKLNPSLTFLEKQLVYCLVHCLLDVEIYASL